MKKTNLLGSLLISLSLVGLCLPDKALSVSPSVKAATCLACHGPQGISSNSLWPNLAGQKKDYLVKQLQAFKSGLRQDPMMAPMASQLSESEMQEISQYFSDLPGTNKAK